MGKFEEFVDTLDLNVLRRELLKGHYDYQAFNKNFRSQLKLFTFIFSLLVALNFYTITIKIDSDKPVSIIVNLMLIVFNTFMATNSFTRIKYEKMRSEMEEKDFNNLLSSMDKFEEEKRKENE